MSETSRRHLPMWSRREALQVSALGLVAGCDDDPTPALDATVRDATDAALSCDATPDGFFSECDLAALAAIADYVLPPDKDPGGAGLGVVDYIAQLVTAFDHDPPRIWAGGPFSGRRPYASPAGAISSMLPMNRFGDFVPLDRVSTAAWRLFLFGNAAGDGGAPDASLVGAVEGLRPLLRRGLDALSDRGALRVDVDTVATRWPQLDEAFRKVVVTLVVEGSLADPVYGGNRNGAGWRLVHHAGDSQPLGYSLFDTTAMTYRERSDAPVSTRDPGKDLDPIDDATARTVRVVALALGGRVRP